MTLSSDFFGLLSADSLSAQTKANAFELAINRAKITPEASARTVTVAREAIKQIADSTPLREYFSRQTFTGTEPPLAVSLDSIPSAIFAKDTLIRVIASDSGLSRRRKLKK